MVIHRHAKKTRPESEEERSRRLYETFLPTAKGIEAHRIIPCRADVALAYRNIAAGVAEVLTLEDIIKNDLPKIDIEQLRTLPELSISVVYAATQLDRHTPTKEVLELLTRARDLRNLLLVTAESLAHAKIFQPREVAKIRSGRGDIDAAKDCIELAALFVKHGPALRGKTPVTNEQIKEAAEVGERLLAVLKPKKVRLPKKVHDEEAEARDHRDRLWTLLVERHDTLRRVGAYLFGVRDLDAHVPALQTRVFVKRAASKARSHTEIVAIGDTAETERGEDE